MVTGPVVNLNGTDGRVLLDNYQNVMNAAVNLMNAMQKVYPHGRDWQTSSPENLSAARDEWSTQLLKAAAVHGWATDMAMSIYNQTEE